MTKQRMHLGEILFKAGLVEKQALINAIKTSKSSNKRLGQVLLELGLINEDTLAKAIAKQFGLKYVDLDEVTIPPDAVKIIPEDLIKRHNILPLGVNNGRLRLIISDPMDLDMMDSVRLRLNKELECHVANPKKIRDYIENSLADKVVAPEDDRLKHSIDATAAELAEAGHELQAEALRIQAAGGDDEGPVIRLVNLIIDTAYHMRASDIHIEPMADRVRIRYRVDGVCLEKDNIPKNMQAPLVARFKILSGMDIAEKRLPQDGRIKRNIAGSDIDFRVSSLPGVHGPSVVLRILRPDAVNIGIESLGFEQDNYEQFQGIIKRPNGIFLVTGPTGSGKTTTLYAALQELNKPDKKIITAEDPVEYMFAGMNQCQVKEEIGLTFDKILRAMLRQAPNIILVGEIRDGEVADKRCVQRDHSSDRYGGQTLPGGQFDSGHHGPAADSCHLQEVQGGGREPESAAFAAAGNRSGGDQKAAGLQGSGVCRVSQHGLQRPARHLRNGGNEQRDAGIGLQESPDQRIAGGGQGQRHAHARGGRGAQGFQGC
jgi:type IV pilus assembly protein PilB